MVAPAGVNCLDQVGIDVAFVGANHLCQADHDVCLDQASIDVAFVGATLVAMLYAMPNLPASRTSALPQGPHLLL
jgi:hypothetical protein